MQTTRCKALSNGIATDGRFATAFTFPEATGIADSPEWFWNSSLGSICNLVQYSDVRYSGYTAGFDIKPRNGKILLDMWM